MMLKIVKPIFRYIIILVVLFAVFFIAGLVVQLRNNADYNQAKQLFDKQRYDEAYIIFEKLDSYSNSQEMAQKSFNLDNIQKAEAEILNQNYDIALGYLNEIKSEDTDINSKKNEMKYSIAVSLFDDGQYEEAKEEFESIIDYSDSKLYLTQIDIKMIDSKKDELYISAITDFNDGNYQLALSKFIDIEDYQDASSYIKKCEDYLRRMDLNRTVAGGVINSVAITSGGKLLYTDKDNSDFSKTTDWENLVSVDTYGKIIIAIDEDKNLYTAGTYDNGSKIKFDRNTGCIDVATGEQFAVALYSDGKVEAEGHNDDKQCDIADWDDYFVVDIDAGWRFAVGLTNGGELLFSGVSKSQESEYISEKELWKDVVSISASGGGETAVGSNRHGKGHTVGLTKEGKVVAVGDNSYGQCDVEDWSDIVRVSAGDWYTIGVKSDGTVLITGENKPRMKYINSEIFEKTYYDVAAGYGQSLFVTSGGSLDAYGFDDNNKQSIADSWDAIKVKKYK
ncbi:Regulator of chromosome condensation (RCC1) repeat-containing protein [Pseudobutyrivibrio sp. NOR37]|nr:Regulator of chromosome condensation (RCC1) repeat-containing protein [Pseudobutyrivibrio sp. NOR37]